MSGNRIVFIDSETGGLNPELHSLLSIAFVIWEKNEILDSKEFFINDNVLNVTKEALSINNIDIEHHKINSISSQQAIEDIDNFLNRYFKDDEKITLAGHNITFDTNFLKKFMLSNNYNYHKKFSHRTIDTSTILYYLYLTGELKQKAISSQEAFDLFNIQIPHRHTALHDAIATAELFTNLLSVRTK